MKSVLIFIVLSVTIVSTSKASIIPAEAIYIIKTAELEVSLVDEIQRNIFKVT